MTARRLPTPEQFAEEKAITRLAAFNAATVVYLDSTW
jgi:hypothetical protein